MTGRDGFGKIYLMLSGKGSQYSNLYLEHWTTDQIFNWQGNSLKCLEKIVKIVDKLEKLYSKTKDPGVEKERKPY